MRPRIAVKRHERHQRAVPRDSVALWLVSEWMCPADAFEVAASAERSRCYPPVVLARSVRMGSRFRVEYAVGRIARDEMPPDAYCLVVPLNELLAVDMLRFLVENHGDR